ncbi:MAG TPA: hypothetical protein VNK23_15310 [Candidatus Dormibacteraeota bacterium]|nr:hypothetical protein [Candidatus Dormibacteraeota bacterium]
MRSEASLDLRVADQIWVATALLHRENPQRSDFSKQEILQRAAQEYPEGARRPGISQHISTHCVASKAPSPAKHRMLTRAGTGRRRLFRQGDYFHPARAGGKVSPWREELPEKYHELLDWYETEFDKRLEPGEETAKNRGATAETLMKLMGRISREDADEMIRIIDDCCGHVDANEW